MRHNVLLIDNDLASAKKMASAIAELGFEVVITPPELGMSEVVDKVSPDTIIVRDRTPQFDGFMLCYQIRRSFDLPLILLGDKLEKEVYPPTFKAGADWNYYMELPISYGELAARIKALLWRCGKSVSKYRNDGSRQPYSLQVRGRVSHSKRQHII